MIYGVSFLLYKTSKLQETRYGQDQTGLGEC